MQNPKLNITLSDFLAISQDMLTRDQAVLIFKRAASNPPAVFMYKSTKTQSDRIRKVLRKSDIGLFNQLLTHRRLMSKHVFMPIQPFDSDYVQLKEIAADADEFCRLYDLDLLDGYTYYISKGMDLMSKTYSLSKFKYYKSKIFEVKNREVKKSTDPDPDTTDRAYKMFCRTYNIRHSNEFHDSTIVDFIYVTEICRELGVRYDKYLALQIEYFKTINKVPEPSWLHTTQARERALKLIKNANNAS